LAQDRRVYALVYFCSAIDDLSGAVFYWHLDLELTDMTRFDKFIDSWFTGRCLKHPVVVAVIFYLIGYAVGQA
jgi:hypothetical protein